MDLRQVEYALAVMDHGGFTRAARALHVAQPSLSQSVRRLERELGAPLFLRTGRTVTLSHAGAAFAGPARRLLREAQNVVATVGEHASGATGTVDIVALPTLAVDPLAPLIGRFRAAHPGISVRVLEPSGTAELLSMVHDGRAELGITERVATPRDVASIDVGEQQLLAVLPPGTTAPRRAIALDVFARQPLVLGPAGTSTRQIVERALEEVGATATVAVEIDQRDAVTPLVLDGAGSTALPAPLAREAEKAGAVVVPFTPRLVRPVSVVHRRAELSPAATAFLALLTR